MSERPSRPILRLKNPPKLPPPPPTPWKCKPCGTELIPAEAVDAEGAVRCPACNARLGRLEDFKPDGKVRARPAKASK